MRPPVPTDRELPTAPSIRSAAARRARSAIWGRPVPGQAVNGGITGERRHFAQADLVEAAAGWRSHLRRMIAPKTTLSATKVSGLVVAKMSLLSDAPLVRTSTAESNEYGETPSQSPRSDCDRRIHASPRCCRDGRRRAMARRNTRSGSRRTTASRSTQAIDYLVGVGRSQRRGYGEPGQRCTRDTVGRRRSRDRRQLTGRRNSARGPTIPSRRHRHRLARIWNCASPADGQCRAWCCPRS
jgi:hypothetical protein